MSAEGEGELVVELPPPQEHQWPVLDSEAEFIAVLGGWGSGKSFVAMLKFLQLVFATGAHDEGYSEANLPLSLIVVPTAKVARTSILPTLYSIVPPQLIRQTWESPPVRVLFEHGHMVMFTSFESINEGANAAAVLLDEAHLVREQRDLLNLKARARDSRARRRGVVLCGLPEDGPLRAIFDQPVMPPNQAAFFFATDQNKKLPPNYAADFRAACSYGDAVKYLLGQWMIASDAVFHSWDSSRNVVDIEGERDGITHLAFDVGDHGFALWGQEVKVKCRDHQGREYWDAGVLVVDDFACENLGTDEIMSEVKSRHWKIVPGRSKIFVDPTLRRDEEREVKKAFPDVEIVQQSKGDLEFDISYGVRCVNRALRDADSNARLLFARSLTQPRPSKPWENPERGSVSCMLRSKKNPITNMPVKENKYEHGRDCVRYLTTGLLPVLLPQAQRVFSHEARGRGPPSLLVSR